MTLGYYLTLAALFVAGLAVIVGVSLVARARDRRERQQLQAPPATAIPGFDPRTPAPEYVTELELRDTPAGAVGTELSDAERAQLQAALPDAIRVGAGYVTGDFVTDRASQWAVVDAPVIVWCPDGIGSTRELMTLIAALGGSEAGDRPGLVVLASTLPGDVVETLRVNLVRRTLRSVAVLVDEAGVAPVVERLGVQPLTRANLIADYVPPAALGRAARWISAHDESWALPG